MYANSKYIGRGLLIGLLSFTAFSPCSTMQAKGLTPAQALVLMAALASIAPDEAIGAIDGWNPCDTNEDGVCKRRDEEGNFFSVVRDQTVSLEMQLEGCEGNARCTSKRSVRKYDDGSFKVSLGDGRFSEPSWTCLCEAPKDVVAVCPSGGKKAQTYANATRAAQKHHKFPQPKRKGARRRG